MFSLRNFQATHTIAMLGVVSVLALTGSAIAKDKDGKYSIGQPASAKEIAGWDIDIRPDGMGLPAGSGNVEDGETLYEEKCASCHGSFGEGEGRYPKLAGGEGTLTEGRPEKTIGSYWPYTSTLWDYIYRAMPFTAPQSLEVDEVYAITAYVLYLNELVEDDFMLSRDNFTSVRLPNEASFYLDDRPDVNNKRCMKDCLDPEKIIVTHVLNSSASTANSDEVETAAVIVEQHPGFATYELACKVCHATGVANAPVTGDADAWVERGQQGTDVLYAHAINGFNTMPAKGGQTQLTDAAVKQAVDYMLAESK